MALPPRQRTTWDLETVRVTELVDQPLRPLRLLHHALLVVLADAATQLVVVHRRPVLALSPELRHPHRVLDLEDAGLPVDPADGRAVEVRLGQQLLQELPQVDVRAAPDRSRTLLLLCGQAETEWSARTTPPPAFHALLMIHVMGLTFFLYLAAVPSDPAPIELTPCQLRKNYSTSQPSPLYFFLTELSYRMAADKGKLSDDVTSGLSLGIPQRRLRPPADGC